MASPRPLYPNGNELKALKVLKNPRIERLIRSIHFHPIHSSYINRRSSQNPRPWLTASTVPKVHGSITLYTIKLTVPKPNYPYISATSDGPFARTVTFKRTNSTAVTFPGTPLEIGYTRIDAEASWFVAFTTV